MTAPTNSWPWRSLAQAREPKPPRAYAVPGLLPLPSLSILFGAPGSLKTMLAMDLAVAVATGRDWLPAQDGTTATAFPCPAASVLWVDVDNGNDTVDRRFAALAYDAPVAVNDRLHFVSFPSNPPMLAGDSQAIAQITDAVWLYGARLIVLDNLGAISGDADENSAAMIGVMHALRQLAEANTVALLVIHHKSKGNRARAGDSLRGHSSIEAAVDLALMIERREESDLVTVRTTKTRGKLVARFAARFVYTPDPEDESELLIAKFYSAGNSDRLASARSLILSVVGNGDGPYGQSDLVRLVKDQTGIGRDTTRLAVDALLRDNLLTAYPGEKNNTTLYRLT